VRYHTYEFGESDIHLRTLRDAQQFSDDDGEAESFGISSATWPLFGLVWESGEVLARLMQRHDVTDLRVLEVGCGIGLASLVLKQRRADITATDHHPQAAAFLARNLALNALCPIPFVRAGWHEDAPELGTFDLVIGSDLLYESMSVDLLSSFIERHARASCTVIIVDPGRGLQGKFSRAMAAFGFEGHVLDAPGCDMPVSFKGKAMCYLREARDDAGREPVPG
jgi:predicted nicotinamide N-methyase